MNHIIILNFLTVAIAISAFTYTNILTDRGMILHSINNSLDALITGRFRWAYTILIGCQFCVAGQWALWYYLYFMLIKVGARYELEFHIWFIMQTIFITKIVTYIYYQILDKSSPKTEEQIQLPTIKILKKP